MRKGVHGRGAQSQQRSLTDFCGGYCDVVPHVRLAVQRFGQRDLPVVHIDVELPLQVRVPIDEVPAKKIDHQEFELKLFATPLGAGANRGLICRGETCRLMRL